MDKSSKLIAITHIINPSRFYCRDLSLATKEQEHITKIEKQLDELSEGRTRDSFFYEPKQGDSVAYFYEAGHKWIRCIVDESDKFSLKHVVFLWAVDYGCPIHTSKLQNIFKVPVSIQSKSYIFEAGLQIMPGKLSFDHINCKEVVEFNIRWSDRAVMDFKELIEFAAEVHFISSMNASHPNIHIGDIHLADSNGMMVLGVSAKMLAEKMAMAVSSDHFLPHYQKLFTNHIERWNNNSRSGLKKPEDVMMVGIVHRNTLVTLDEKAVSSIGRSFQKELNKMVRDWQVRNDDSTSEASGPEDQASCRDSWGSSTISDPAAYLETPFEKLKEQALEKLKEEQSLDWSKIGLDDTVAVEKSEVKPRKTTMLAAGAPMIPQNHKLQREPKKVFKTFSQDFSTVDDNNLISVSEVGSVSAVDDQQQN